jgi:hypothetical protein
MHHLVEYQQYLFPLLHTNAAGVGKKPAINEKLAREYSDFIVCDDPNFATSGKINRISRSMGACSCTVTHQMK